MTLDELLQIMLRDDIHITVAWYDQLDGHPRCQFSNSETQTPEIIEAIRLPDCQVPHIGFIALLGTLG